jgi:hypothetical protein
MRSSGGRPGLSNAGEQMDTTPNLQSPEHRNRARPAATGSCPIANNAVLARSELPEPSTDHLGRAHSRVLQQCLFRENPRLKTFRAHGILWGKQATDRAGLADRKVRSSLYPTHRIRLDGQFLKQALTGATGLSGCLIRRRGLPRELHGAGAEDRYDPDDEGIVVPSHAALGLPPAAGVPARGESSFLLGR